MKSSSVALTFRLVSFAFVSALVASAIGCSGDGAVSILGNGADAETSFGDGDSTLDAPVAQVDAGQATHDASRGPTIADAAGDATALHDDGGAYAAGYKLAFVTSATFTGDLGGTAGADKKCQDAAAASTNADIESRAPKFIAWISTGFPGSPGPSARLADAEYQRADGKVVAKNLSALVGGILLAPIDITEQGDSVPAGAAAWTGTAVNGTASTFTCNGFSTNFLVSIGDVGAPPETGSAWTTGTRTTCNVKQRIYCLEGN